MDFFHLVVDVTGTSARTNINVPRIGAAEHQCSRRPLPGSLALGGEQGTRDADLRTSALLGTPFVKSDYYPFPLEDGGRLAPRAT
jgi:hypothetical protein